MIGKRGGGKAESGKQKAESRNPDFLVPVFPISGLPQTIPSWSRSRLPIRFLLSRLKD
jgi:hypothetical protein